MDTYGNEGPFINVLHDTTWHSIMPFPVFYGQYLGNEITLHGGNEAFNTLLKTLGMSPVYPWDAQKIFPSSHDEAKPWEESLESLFTRKPGWVRGSWRMFGGSHVAEYALFEDSQGWFVCFLEIITAQEILEGQALLKKQLEELSNLYSMGEILSPLSGLVRETLGLSWAGMLFWNSGEGRWVLRAYNGGEREKELQPLAMEILKGVQDEEDASGVHFGGIEIGENSLWWSDAGENASFRAELFQRCHVHSFFAGTLATGAQPVILTGFSSHGRSISDIQKKVFQGEWPMICSMVEQYRLVHSVASMTDRDPVTGLAQGASFLRAVDVELRRDRRYGYPISLLYISIQNGETLLREGGKNALQDGSKLLAREILESIRVVDIVGRLDDGGFLVLLPHTEFEGSQVVLRRMKERFSELSPLPHVSLDVFVNLLSYTEGLIPDFDKVLKVVRQR